MCSSVERGRERQRAELTVDLSHGRQGATAPRVEQLRARAFSERRKNVGGKPSFLSVDIHIASVCGGKKDPFG